MSKLELPQQLISWPAVKSAYKITDSRLVELSHEGHLSLYPINGKLFLNKPELDDWLSRIKVSAKDLGVVQ